MLSMSPSNNERILPDKLNVLPVPEVNLNPSNVSLVPLTSKFFPALIVAIFPIVPLPDAVILFHVYPLSTE